MDVDLVESSIFRFYTLSKRLTKRNKKKLSGFEADFGHGLTEPMLYVDAQYRMSQVMMNSFNFEIVKKEMFTLLWSEMTAKKGNNEFLSCLDYMWLNYPTLRGQGHISFDGANTNVTQTTVKYLYLRCSDYSQQRIFERLIAFLMPIGHNFQQNDRNAWQAEDSWVESKLGFATVKEKVEYFLLPYMKLHCFKAFER